MQVKSDRQFRSYVISWFLLIVGFIVFLGAYYIYHSAQDYFFTSYKKNKLEQIYVMSMLVPSDQHKRITTKSALYQSLSNVFTQTARADSARHPVYSLNFDRKNQTFAYGVDPRKAKADSIHINSELVELLVFFNEGNQIKVELIHDYSDLQSDLVDENRLKPVLARTSNGIDLVVNNTVILSFNNDNSFEGRINQLVINNKALQTQTTRLSMGNPVTFHYRFIRKNGAIHPPGSLFLAPEVVLNNLKAATAKTQSEMIGINPTLSVSQTLLVAPIDGKDNQPSGLLLMELSRKSLQQLGRTFLESVLIGFGLMMVLIMIAAIFFARKITTPLEQLNSAIARLIHNDFNFKLSTKGFGSFGFIAKQFNLMLAHIQTSRSELIHLNKSYSRFVPHQLLKQLSPSGVNNISLGDSCERDMTVLFCDIRGFTTLSESMTPQANFTFINRYLSQIAPVINKRGGIIDKYLGDGIMALFPNGADQALKAAIEMLDALSAYNETLIQKNLPIVEVGLGLHSGRMMLGTVGTPARMDATVVSDTVNAAARVESMTKAFCTRILITEETKRQLKDIDYYNIRYIASCRIQGKSKPVTLYEVFNNDSASLKIEKAVNQSMMIRAWKKYKSGDQQGAIALYQKIIEKSPNDKSLFALIERCQSGRL